MGAGVLFRRSFAVEGGDFERAGEVSTQIKAILKGLGFDHDVVRHTAIATFEAEMNIVIHAWRGTVLLEITAADIEITAADSGPGISDIALAMTEGYSTASEEAREMGFGAGMGLPNIQRNSDLFEIESAVGEGTTLHITLHHASP
jgi:anti-sigma regulatory factor (Ser/Thr protein kinase)